MSMKGSGGRKGLIIFMGVLLCVIIGSFMAYILTGPMGIEERYSHAVGVPYEEEEGGSGWFGFSLEGNPILYITVIIGLAVICIVLYKYAKF